MKPHALAPLAVLVALCAAAPARAQVFGDAAALDTNAGLDAAAEAGSGQQVATDGQGTWVAVFATRSDLAGNGTDFDIAVARSLDGGVSWTAPAVLNGNAFGDTASDNDAAIATDGTTWVAAWTSTVGGNSDLLYARSTDGGVTWSAPAVLDADPGVLGDFEVTLATDGTSWVATWTYGATLTEFDVRASRSTDGGATWSAPVFLNANPATDTASDVHPDVATDGAGTFIVAWNTAQTLASDADILVARSVDGGATWAPAAPLAPNAGSDVAVDIDPDLATDGHGTWLAVWASRAGVLADPDIVVSHSTDDGVSWTAPAIVNSDFASDATFDGKPSVTTDGHGLWLAAWASEDTALSFDVRLARSADAGATWSPSPEDLGRKPAGDDGSDTSVQVASDGRGTFLGVWISTDTLGGTIGTDADVLFALAVGADHYDCYQARPTPGAPHFVPVNVSLEDQFGLVPAVRLERPRTICAPASKNAEPVIDPTAHLTCYTMKDNTDTPFRPVDVSVWNQFGPQRLKVRKPTQLCVPSEKNGVASALNVDHYRCYKAKFADRPGFGTRTVTLADQFQSRTFTAAPCVRFCTPVSKNGEEILNPAAHLTCYKLLPQDATPPFLPQPVTLVDQLGSLDLTVRPLLDLCVPSLKTVLP